jgi:uncharacterized membrane protein YfcA
VLAQWSSFLFFGVGLLAGTIDAIAGGGGLITVPVLLSAGLPPQLALGTNKLQSVCGTASAAFSYYRQGWLKRQGLFSGLLSSGAGAILGALATQVTSNALLNKIIPLILLLVFIYVIFCPRLGHQDATPKLSLNRFYFVFGTLLGFYDGFFGPGTGGFWVFLLMYLLGYNLLKATAYTKVFNLNTNIIAMLCFALGGNIDYRIGLCMALGQLLGGRIGAQLAMHKGTQLVRPLFLFMMLVAILTLLYRDHSAASSVYELGFAFVFVLITFFYIWKMKKSRSLESA